MFLEPSKSKPARRRYRRGFTLVELIVVVVIIGITAAMATPTVVTQMRERRARETAVQVARVYSSARMRAMGRGSAVMVRFLNGSFTTVESIEGAVAVARDQDACATAPGLGCLSTLWAVAENSRQVDDLAPHTDITIKAKQGATERTQLQVCFSPGGRSFVSFDANPPTTPFAGSIEFEVQRTEGLLRRVALLPNGNARLAL